MDVVKAGLLASLWFAGPSYNWYELVDGLFLKGLCQWPKKEKVKEVWWHMPLTPEPNNKTLETERDRDKMSISLSFISASPRLYLPIIRIYVSFLYTRASSYLVCAHLTHLMTIMWKS